MGVNMCVLRGGTRREVVIGDHRVKVGILDRMGWKITERTPARLAAEKALEAAAEKARAPKAVLIEGQWSAARTVDGRTSSGRLIGWDGALQSVSDWDWGHLPELGHLIELHGDRILHEEVDGILAPMTTARAQELGILDEKGALVRRGQPKIIECRSVRAFYPPRAIVRQTDGALIEMKGCIEAECLLEDGREWKPLPSARSVTHLPDPSWFVGKFPREVDEWDPGLAYLLQKEAEAYLPPGSNFEFEVEADALRLKGLFIPQVSSGTGTEFFARVLNLADQYGVRSEFEAHTTLEPGARDIYTLVRWYQRFGFEWTGLTSDCRAEMCRPAKLWQGGHDAILSEYEAAKGGAEMTPDEFKVRLDGMISDLGTKASP